MKLKDTPFYRKYHPGLSTLIVERTTCVRRQHSYIYFRVPKAANTLISSNLYLNENRAFDLSTEEINHYKVSFERPSSLSQDEVSDLRSFFKFTVVRHPSTRILSCYLQKILGGAKEKSIVTKSMGVSDDFHISFEDFLGWLAEDNNLLKNYHWCPQSALVSVGVENLDFIGKVESLSQDLDFILDTIFGDSRVKKQIDFSPGKTHATQKQEEYFSSQSRDLTFRLYEADFENFRYEPSK